MRGQTDNSGEQTHRISQETQSTSKQTGSIIPANFDADEGGPCG
jgi:hypothetical protein